MAAKILLMEEIYVNAGIYLGQKEATANLTMTQFPQSSTRNFSELWPWSQVFSCGYSTRFSGYFRRYIGFPYISISHIQFRPQYPANFLLIHNSRERSIGIAFLECICFLRIFEFCKYPDNRTCACRGNRGVLLHSLYEEIYIHGIWRISSIYLYC